jgi:hypothetical protein
MEKLSLFVHGKVITDQTDDSNVGAAHRLQLHRDFLTKGRDLNQRLFS